MELKKEIMSITCVSILSLSLLAGCGSPSSQSAARTDGTYTGKSSEDDRGAYGEATITIQDGKIADCKYVTWQKDGTIKDENYGKVNGQTANEDYYQKAQIAVSAMKQYAAQLVEVQKLEDVDAVSGATISFDQFTQAVTEALKEAQQ